MKKIFFFFLLLISFAAQAQRPNFQWSKIYDLSGELRFKGDTITAISEDTTSTHRSRHEVMTEKAVKDYAQKLIDSLKTKSPDSTIWQTVFRSDTARANTYHTIDTIRRQVISSDGSIIIENVLPNKVDFRTSLPSPGNYIVSTGGIDLVDSTVSVLGPIIFKQGAAQDTLPQQDVIIPAAASGYYRKDVLFINSSGAFDTLRGIPDTSIAVAQAIPAGGILISEVSIFGSVIDTPIIASNFQRSAIPWVNLTTGKYSHDSLYGPAFDNLAKWLEIAPQSTSAGIRGASRFSFSGGQAGAYLNTGSWGGITLDAGTWDNSKPLYITNRGNRMQGWHGSTNPYTQFYNGTKIIYAAPTGSGSPSSIIGFDGDTLKEYSYSAPTSYWQAAPSGTGIYNSNNSDVAIGDVAFTPSARLHIKSSSGLDQILQSPTGGILNFYGNSLSTDRYLFIQGSNSGNQISSKGALSIITSTNTPVILSPNNNALPNLFYPGATGIGLEYGVDVPTATLEVGSINHAATLKYVDGNEGSGKVLTSDADGLATWQTPSGSSSAGYVVQASAPSDTTILWLDTTPGFKRVWPLKQRIRAAWQTVRWYDPIANFFSDKRPLFVLNSGQSNSIPRCCGGDTTSHPLVVEYRNNAWRLSQTSVIVSNNIGLQFAKQVARKENRVVRFATIAEVSQPIDKWLHDSTKTDEIAALIREAQIDSFDVILFRQGEQNATLGNTEAQYAAKFSQVFTAYRDSTWFGKSGRIIAGGMNEGYYNTGVFDFYYHLNNGEKRVADAVGVNMLGLSLVNGIHISGASIDTVGLRYYMAYRGGGSQYSLEKTPNIGWITDTELGLTPISSTSFPTLRLQQSSSNGRRGGYLKYDNSKTNLLIGTNAVNSGATTADSIAIAVNEFGQVGIGKTNGTLTSNLSQFNISTYKAMAFSITLPGTNTAALQIDNQARFVNKPINVYNRFSATGDILIHSQSGDVNNGILRFSRVNLSGTTIPSYNGFYQYFNGSTNRFIIGSHGSSDTTAANDLGIMYFSQSNTGVTIKKDANATAYLELGAGVAAANGAPLKFTAGTNLTTPSAGAVEFDGTNWFATASTTRYTIAKTLTATSTLDFGSTAAGAVSDLTITVTGAADGDAVSLGVPNGSIVASGNFTAWVSATNTVTVRYSNNDLTTARDPASGTFRASVIKY